MSTIGAGWKQKDKNDKPYISCKVDKELLPLTIDNSKRLALFPITDKQSDNAPDFRLVIFSAEEKTEGVKAESTGEDFPF